MKWAGPSFRASNGVIALGLALCLFGVQGPLSIGDRSETMNGLSGRDLSARSLPSGAGHQPPQVLPVLSPHRMIVAGRSALNAASPEDGWADDPRNRGILGTELQPTRWPAGSAPTWISIPAIQLEAPVELSKAHRVSIEHREFLEWDAPDSFAAGWQEGSAPLGISGNTVINGHNNENGDVFLYLVKVKPGDQITLFSAKARFDYEVTNRMLLPEQDQELEIRLANAVWIQPSPDERLTLVTCWPWNGNSHRLVIVARPVNEAGSDKE